MPSSSEKRFLLLGRIRLIDAIITGSASLAVLPPLIMQRPSENLCGIVDHVIVVSVRVKHLLLSQDGVDVHLPNRSYGQRYSAFWFFRALISIFVAIGIGITVAIVVTVGIASNTINGSSSCSESIRKVVHFLGNLFEVDYTQHPIRIAQPQARSGNFLARVCIVIFTTIDITIAINRGILVGTCLVCDRQRLLFLVLEFIHRKKGNPTADGVDPWIWVGFGRPSIVVGIVAIVVIVVVIVIFVVAVVVVDSVDPPGTSLQKSATLWSVLQAVALIHPILALVRA
mmetsp:Transcript_286/g.552  ORF Transcript_286/g.552 Transcript_286/m.552 type:complete len:285 (-) Transcript_286:659-1513(-)